MTGAVEALGTLKTAFFPLQGRVGLIVDLEGPSEPAVGEIARMHQSAGRLYKIAHDVPEHMCIEYIYIYTEMHKKLHADIHMYVHENMRIYTDEHTSHAYRTYASLGSNHHSFTPIAHTCIRVYV